MRYIEKHHDAPIVVQHEQELSQAGLDEASLTTRKATGEKLDGSTLYKKIRSTENIPHWQLLKDYLNEEQGGVCCYCGAKLQYPDTGHYSVEHVRPRSKYPELVGEYRNLLLSCHCSESERADINNNVHNRRDRLRLLHCDEYKKDEELHYTPLDADCPKHFSYKIDGSVQGDSKEANSDIATLNLNCKALQDRRREQMLSYLFAETANGPEMLDKDSLSAFRRAVGQRGTDGNYCEFYFVIADIIDQLLNPKED